MILDQLQEQKKAEKLEVANYFNGMGFERWNRIYSESTEVNNVQRNIRIGHLKTVNDVLQWIKESGKLDKISFCDAGCGVGSLTLPLAELDIGSISASDISESMIKETKLRAEAAQLDLDKISFNVSDLESLSGSFHTVICLDVFIHYPQEAAEEMVKHLCNLTEERLIVSFAPYTPLLALLKKIGQFFPGPSKTTRAYTLRETGINTAARECGFEVVRSKLNKAPFYFSKLIEFRKVS
tara:strand:+ start:9426 stop:10142 length:717 start_codon:yes stop_codon:yes gene_type:complete